MDKVNLLTLAVVISVITVIVLGFAAVIVAVPQAIKSLWDYLMLI